MIDRNSIRFKIITPLLIFLTIIMLSLLIVGYQVSKNVFWEYHTFIISRHSSEVQKIVNTAINELTTSGLLDKEMVVDAKKKAVIDEIKSYWLSNNLAGFIKTTDGNIVYSSLNSTLMKSLEPHLPEDGDFHFSKTFTHIGGSVINIPLWNCKAVFIEEPLIPFIYLLSRDTTTALMAPLIAISCILIAVVTFLVMRKNLQKPIEAMISNIQAGQEVNGTGITELDTVGSAINNAFERLNKKTAQYQTLHNIAVSIHEYFSIDEILNLIIDRASQLINAELAAITLYDDKGKFKRLITRGTTIRTGDALPEGKGLLKFMRLSITPVRIDNVSEHHAFSGSFPEGHPVIRNLLAYPIFSGEGRPVGALYFGNKPEGFTDDDESILKAISADAAIALNKAENLMQLQRFQQVIDSAFDVIVVTDADGYITYVNPAFETVTGYSVQEAIGKKTNILKSGYHDEDFYKNLWNTIKAGDAWKGEFINRKKNGEIYYASSVIFPIYAEGDVQYASIQRDVTQEKKLYEQLLRAQKMEAIGTLAGGIAHDFNNLLTAILGYSEIMLGMTKEGEPFYRPATIINNAAQKGADLAKKILMVTRKEKMEAKPVNINEIIHNSMELLQRSIPKNIEIVINLKEDVPKIMADPSQMQQVIMNLAVNARDAMQDGGRLIIETAVVGTENGAANGIPFDKGGFIKLSVSDTGTGMDTETQRKIFDPFFTTKETGKGTGLGLYIVHSVVSNHGGYVNLYSEPFKGTRFNIYLPITKTADMEESGEAEDIMGSGTILVIDDETDVRELCKDMLEPLGYTVLLAGSGSDGINLFRAMKDKISLVIVDMIMPKMGGSEVFQALKTIKPDIKVILCSGYSHEGFAGIDKLLKSGAAGFVQKPFTRHSIAQAIKKALSE
jgi:PAS domain S-box-containing protein